MDKPRRLAAIIIAASEAETAEQYATRRDEVWRVLDDKPDEFVKCVYDDLRYVFSKFVKPPVNINAGREQENSVTGDERFAAFDPAYNIDD